MSTASIIVIGSGEVTKQEVHDLLTDFLKPYDGVDVYFPVDTKGFTKAVEFTYDWVDQEDIYPFLLVNAKQSRKFHHDGEPLRTQSVAALTTMKKETDEQFLLVALPDPEEQPDDYDDVMDVIEAAVAADIPVKDLTGGLDDVRLDAPPAPEPEPEPDPEPEKPKARTRTSSRKTTAKASEPAEEPKKFEGAVLSPEAVESVRAMANFIGLYQALTVLSGEVAGLNVDQFLAELGQQKQTQEAAQEAPSAPEKPAEAPRRGRGRPRVNTPQEKQIWDEDTEEWIPRPRGRQAKGTKTRTINPETDEVLEEGEV